MFKSPVDDFPKPIFAVLGVLEGIPEPVPTVPEPVSALLEPVFALLKPVSAL